MKIFNIFKKKKYLNQQPIVEQENSNISLDPVKEEVEQYCKRHNIDDEELQNIILGCARAQNLKNYIEKGNMTKPVMVVANGPKSCLDETPNRQECVFCFMNNSPLSPIFWKIKPEYYIQADPLFFKDVPPKQDIKYTREKLINEVSWDMVFFVPFYQYEKALKIYSSNQHLNILPYHDSNISINLECEKKNIIYRLGLDAPIVQNVVVGAIYCLINSGYKKLELYGVNHSWTTQLLVNEKNEVCLKDEHFYDKKEAKITPWYKVSGSIYKMHEILRDLAQMFDSYWVLKDYAESEGVTIINKTKGSFIDAFERG